MVLNLARILLLGCLFAVPLAGAAQKLKTNSFDRFLRKQRLETFPLPLRADEESKMNLSLRAVGTSFSLVLQGRGLGTNTVDQGNALVLRLANGDSVVMTSPDVQPLDYTTLPPGYKHSYPLSYNDLEKLGQAALVSVRKFAVARVDDISVDAKAGVRASALATFFAGELRTARLVPKKIDVLPPAFPGGAETWVRFLNRNLRADTAETGGLATVRFVVDTDGAVRDLNVTQSDGSWLNDELLRILKRMPRWKPAMQDGRKIEASVAHRLRVQRTGQGWELSLL